MKLIEAEEMVLEGVVVPIAWGPSGEVMEVGIMTYDEAEYRIEPGTAGDHSLSDYLRKPVRLSAVIRGSRVIQVRRVEVYGSADLGSQQHKGRDRDIGDRAQRFRSEHERPPLASHSRRG